MNNIINFIKVLLLSTAICSCSDQSSSQLDEVGIIEDVQRATSTLGTVSYTADRYDEIRWNNYTTAESGISRITESGSCDGSSNIFLPGCSYSWRVIIPLTDGENDIVLTDTHTPGYGNTYSERVLYTDSGPPEVLSYGEYISEAYGYTYIYVLFNKYMNPDSINYSTIFVEDADGNRVDDGRAYLLSFEGDKASLDICHYYDCSGYTVRVTTGVTDYWGTPISTEQAWIYGYDF